MITEIEFQEGKRLWEKLNHREVISKASWDSSVSLSDTLISFYDHSYWFEFTATQKRQLLKAMREMENEKNE